LGARQREMLVDPEWRIGGADLVGRQGVYYLHVTQRRQAPPEQLPVDGALGSALAAGIWQLTATDKLVVAPRFTLYSTATIQDASDCKRLARKAQGVDSSSMLAGSAGVRETLTTVSARPWPPMSPYPTRHSPLKT